MHLKVAPVSLVASQLPQQQATGIDLSVPVVNYRNLTGCLEIAVVVLFSFIQIHTFLKNNSLQSHMLQSLLPRSQNSLLLYTLQSLLLEATNHIHWNTSMHLKCPSKIHSRSLYVCKAVCRISNSLGIHPCISSAQARYILDHLMYARLFAAYQTFNTQDRLC